MWMLRRQYIAYHRLWEGMGVQEAGGCFDETLADPSSDNKIRLPGEDWRVGVM